VNKQEKSRFAVVEEAARLMEDVAAWHDQLAQAGLVDGNQRSKGPQLTAGANDNDVGASVLGIERAQTGIGPLMAKKR
jgi:hypothetical protein